MGESNIHHKRVTALHIRAIAVHIVQLWVFPVCFTYPRYCLTCGAVHSHHLHRSVPYTVARQKKGFGSLPLVLNV